MNDPVFPACHLLFFTETWTKPGDEYHFEGYDEIVRINSFNPQRRLPGGIAIFAKNVFTPLITNIHVVNIPGVLQLARFLITSCNLCIIVVYCHSNTSLAQFRVILERGRHVLFHGPYSIIMCGDFNFDISKSSNLKTLMEVEFGLHLISNPQNFTTNKNTTIDAVFASYCWIDSLDCIVYESLMSYHKPIVLRRKEA